MFTQTLIVVLLPLLVVLALRKATIVTSALSDNAGSFVNVTAERLHIRLLDLVALPESTAGVSGDAAIASVDEVPVDQSLVNDSRSHIMAIAPVVGGAGIEATAPQKALPFNRNDLVLDPDDAIFLNTTDVSGNLDVTFNLNVWYED